jgi:phosphatidylglycerol:prolipoprotein diacylglycerol transferase
MPEQGSLPALGSLLHGLGYTTGAVVFWLATRLSRHVMPQGRERLIILGAAIIGGMLGSKLTQWLALGWPFGNDPLAILIPTAGGRTVLGGILCGWIAVEIAKSRLGIRYSMGLPFALALPAGEAVGRIGCWFNGCCGGRETALPWAVQGTAGMVHPSQFYMFAGLLLLLGALLWLRSRIAAEGDLFLYYLAGYGLLRFLTEFTRSQDALILGLSLAQWICLLFIIAGSSGLLVRQRDRRDNEGMPPQSAAREQCDG